MSLRLPLQRLARHAVPRTFAARSLSSEAVEAEAPQILASTSPVHPSSRPNGSLVADLHPHARAETPAFAPYEWDDPLKVRTLLSEEEQSIL